MSIDALIVASAAIGGPIHIGVAAAHLGVPTRRLRAQARRSGWRFPFRDVACPPGLPDGARVRALAAVAQLSGPDPGAPRPVAVSRWSAADLYGVGIGAPSRVQVVVPTARAPRDRPGALEVVRSRTWDDAAIRVIGGVPVVSPPWLVRSCAAVATTSALTDLVIDLVQRRHTTMDAISAEHLRWAQYPGSGRVAAVLDLLGSAGRTDSTLELRTRRRLLAAGVPLDRGQVAVPCADGRAVHLDLGIAAIRFGIDVDSMLAHSSRRQLHADVRRSNALATTADDWRIVRATAEDLGPGWEAFVAVVRQLISLQAQRYLGVPWPRPEDLARG